jgi:hypothetical protein
MAFQGSSKTTGMTQGSKTTQTETALDPNMMKILTSLIAELQGGGTPTMRAQQGERNQEIASTRSQQADFSKEAAFDDAQGAMAQQSRMILEKLLPTLVRSAEGAGTSQNSMRALMTQQAANQAAESASALGLNAAASYGGIANNFASILERLTQVNDPATQALISALGVARGASTTRTTTQSNPPSMIAPMSTSVAPAPRFSETRMPSLSQQMSFVAPQMTTDQAQISSINKQLGLLGDLTRRGSFGDPYGNVKMSS